MARKFSAYTIIELLMAMALTAVAGTAMLSFTTMASRLLSRNLATNHGHQNAQSAGQAMLARLWMSSSSFALLTASGTTYTDSSAVISGNLDPHSNSYRSEPRNGVRFWLHAGGPFQITANTTATSTNLTANFAVNGAVSYVPQVGDKVELPLANLQFDITAIVTTPSSGSPTGTVTLGKPVGVTINSAAPNNTSATFYRRVAYTVQSNELRYHPNFAGTSRTNYVVVARGVTSPTPFSLLYETSTSDVTDALELHTSLELTDLERSAGRFASSTTTLQAVYSPRNQPTSIKTNN